MTREHRLKKKQPSQVKDKVLEDLVDKQIIEWFRGTPQYKDLFAKTLELAKMGWEDDTD
jgi:hypothetical protein